MTFPESDWKEFRRLRAIALERHCETTLEQCRAVCGTHGPSAHERYKELYRLIETRDRELAMLFDDFRRSTAIHHLVAMSHAGVVGREELEPFSGETRRIVRELLALSR